MCRSVGYSRCARRSTGTAPSRSCTDAGVMLATSRSPSTSTSKCRLRPFTFFSRVESPGASDVGRLDALAIDDASRRFGLASLCEPYGPTEFIVERIEHPLSGPPLVALEDCGPRRKVVRQGAPRNARPRPVADGIEHLARMMLWLLQILDPDRRREPGGDELPLFVGQIGGVAAPGGTFLEGHAPRKITPGPGGPNFLWNTL